MRKNIPARKNVTSAKVSSTPKKEDRKKNLPSESWFQKLLPLLILLPVIFIAFFPSLNNDLTNWDDPSYLPENPLIRTLDGASIKRIFTENYFGNYQPLHILSYAIEYHFYGLNPKGYHTTSVIMFVMACALVYWFILLLSNNKIIAAITTSLYGLNAMRVESVAWAAERKDLMYLVFLVASLIAYLYYIRKDESYKYLLFSFLLFTLSIYSKVMAASIIGPMIMLDYYIGRKFSVKLVLEKVPYVLLSFYMGWKQVSAVKESGTIDTSNVFSFGEKILIACRNLIFYPIKLIAPVNLSAFYPYPPKTAQTSLPWEFYLCGVLVVILAVLLFMSAKKTKLFLFCGGFFVSTIALVLQLMPVGPTMFSERYSLVPGIAFAFLLASGIYYLIENKPDLKNLVYGVLGVYLCFLFYTTFQRCKVWNDSLTLWDNVLEQYPKVATALNNRGKHYGEHLQKYDEAMRDLTASIQADPNYELAYNNRGIVYSIRKQFDLAIKDFDQAIRLKPNYMEAIHNRAISLANSKQFDRAITDFTRIIRENPDKEESYVARGYTYLQVGKFNEGLQDLNRAIQLNPNDGNAYVNRSQAMYYLKRYKEALADVQMATSLGAQIDPNYRNQIEAAAK
ncbi:MAG: tetratricopeptide repeat protein [Bacteroidia bacterium]